MLVFETALKHVKEWFKAIQVEHRLEETCEEWPAHQHEWKWDYEKEHKQNGDASVNSVLVLEEFRAATAEQHYVVAKYHRVQKA